MEIFSTADSDRTRPSTAMVAPDQGVGVVDHRPHRPEHDEQAADDPDREVHLRTGNERLDDAERQQPHHHDREAADGVRHAIGHTERTQHGHGPDRHSDRPSRNGIVCAAARPFTTSNVPSVSGIAARSQSAPASATGRIGKIPHRRHDVEDTHAPRGERDDQERQQHAHRVRDQHALPSDGEVDADRFGGERLSDAGDHGRATRRPRAAHPPRRRSDRMPRPRTRMSARGVRVACRSPGRRPSRYAVRRRASRRSRRSTGCRRRSRSCRKC